MKTLSGTILRKGLNVAPPSAKVGPEPPKSMFKLKAAADQPSQDFKLPSKLRDRDPDAKPMTLEQVGKLIGVTKERVRQIQNKALEKIRHTLEDEYLG